MYVFEASMPMISRLGSGGATSTSICKRLWAPAVVVKTAMIAAAMDTKTRPCLLSVRMAAILPWTPSLAVWFLGKSINWRNQATVQVCAFPSPVLPSVSDMGFCNNYSLNAKTPRMKATQRALNPIVPALPLCLTVLFCAAATPHQRPALPSGPKGDWQNTEWRQSFQPKAGVVPDEQTAIRIAEAILLPIYGEKIINSERPLRASLRGGVWMVQGTLPKGFNGGTAVMRLSRDDGRVLFITHYR